MACVQVRSEREDFGLIWTCGPGVRLDHICWETVDDGMCARPADHLCDYPMDRRQTCDRPLCSEHAIRQGLIRVEFCPAHSLMAVVEAQ